LESGADEVLAYMEKGVTAEENIRGGRRVVEAGISLSEYVMPGLGGRRWSERHALESARVVNEIGPDFVRLRSLIVGRGGLLDEQVESGDFEVMDEDEIVAEIGLIIENLDCNTYVASDQMSNLLWEVEGRLPKDKQAMLDTVNGYLSKGAFERLRFCLERRRRSFAMVYGGLPPGVQEEVQRAFDAIQHEAPDAAERVRTAMDLLKRSFV
jgi:radical SAM superfamily enzyme